MQRVNEMAMARQRSCEEVKEKMQQKAASQGLAGELWATSAGGLLGV